MSYLENALSKKEFQIFNLYVILALTFIVSLTWLHIFGYRKMFVRLGLEVLSPVMPGCRAAPRSQTAHLDAERYPKMNSVVHRKNSKGHCAKWEKIVTSVKTAKRYFWTWKMHSHSSRTTFFEHTLSINLLAWRLKLLKNIFLLSKCISSMVVNNVAALFPTMPLKAKDILGRKTS